MTKIKLWLAIAAAVIGAFFGIKATHAKQLRKEKARTARAQEDALRAGDAAGAATAARDVARIERDLAAQRAAPVGERVAAAVAEARRRRAGGAAG